MMNINAFGRMSGIIGAIALSVTGCALAQSSADPVTVEPIPVAQTAPPKSASPQPSPQSYKVKKTTLLKGLEHPWSMVWLPDGAVLITERPGRLRLVRNGVLDPTPIAGVPSVLAVGQGGLMDVSLHPQFAKNRWIYLTYAHGTPEANRTRLARATLDGKTLRDVRVIFEVAQTKSDTQHFGSRIGWLPDGTLLLAIGDGGNPPVALAGDLIRKQAQNRRSHLGKILRLREDGSIPPDNPFVKQPEADPAVWSYGHRNIQGLAVNPLNQQVWATEHGAKGGDEVNWVEAGKNYGWPIVTYSREYFGPEITTERSRPGMVDAKLVWTPSIAPSGLTFYSGDRFPAWKGDLFAGALVTRQVRHLKLDAIGQVVHQESIEIGQRVRDVRQGPDGLLYVLTDEGNGALIRLEPTLP
jgi:aldose sugar dehydrogenase